MRFTVPFNFSAGDQLDLVPEENRHLVYDLVPRATRQSVTNGRLHVLPVIDFDAYRAVALIDWVEIAFRTGGVHQALNINTSLRRLRDVNGAHISPRVAGPAREARYQGSHFIVRLQDPTPKLVRSVASHLHDKYEIVSREPDFEITGVEISVDFYPRPHGSPNAAALALRRWTFSEMLRKHLIVDPGFLFPHGARTRTRLIVDHQAPVTGRLRDEIDGTTVTSAEVAALRLARHHQAPLDGTYYVGRKDGEVHLRLQDKTADRRDPKKNSVMLLAPEERRSRIEICLLKRHAGADGGPALIGMSGLDDLYGFRFARVRKARLHFEQVETAAFDFAIPTIEASPDDPVGSGELEVEVFRKSGAYGLDGYQRAARRRQHARWERGQIEHRPGKIGRKGHCVAYDDLNQMINVALRGLARRWGPD